MQSNYITIFPPTQDFSLLFFALSFQFITLFQPPPESPIFGGLKLKMKIEKFKALFTLGTALKGFRRATHTVGTGGVGEVKIVDNPKFPEHEFFRAG